MLRLEEKWMNFERGVCLSFGGLLLFFSAGFWLDVPAPVHLEIDARAPRANMSERDVITILKPHLDVVPMTVLRDDPFTPVELALVNRMPVKPPKPVRPITPVVGVKPVAPVKPPTRPDKTVVLKPKPQKVIDEPNPDDDAITETTVAPFPVVAMGFVEPSGKEGRQVIVRLLEGGPYFKLREDDEFKVSEQELLKVIEITPTSVTFEREDGSLHCIDKDPLHAWKPLLRDELDTLGFGGGLEEPAEGFDIFTQPKDVTRPKAPSQNDTAAGGDAFKEKLRDEFRKQFKKDVDDKQLDQMLQEMKQRNPDMLKQLKNLF